MKFAAKHLEQSLNQNIDINRHIATCKKVSLEICSFGRHCSFDSLHSKAFFTTRMWTNITKQKSILKSHLLVQFTFLSHLLNGAEGIEDGQMDRADHVSGDTRGLTCPHPHPLFSPPPGTLFLCSCFGRNL